MRQVTWALVVALLVLAPLQLQSTPVRAQEPLDLSPLVVLDEVGNAATEPVSLTLPPGKDASAFTLLIRNDADVAGTSEFFAWATTSENGDPLPAISLAVKAAGQAGSDGLILGPGGVGAITLAVSGVDRPGTFGAVLVE